MESIEQALHRVMCGHHDHDDHLQSVSLAQDQALSNSSRASYSSKVSASSKAVNSSKASIASNSSSSSGSSIFSTLTASSKSSISSNYLRTCSDATHSIKELSIQLPAIIGEDGEVQALPIDFYDSIPLHHPPQTRHEHVPPTELRIFECYPPWIKDEEEFVEHYGVIYATCWIEMNLWEYNQGRLCTGKRAWRFRDWSQVVPRMGFRAVEWNSERRGEATGEGDVAPEQMPDGTVRQTEGEREKVELPVPLRVRFDDRVRYEHEDRFGRRGVRKVHIAESK